MHAQAAALALLALALVIGQVTSRPGADVKQETTTITSETETATPTAPATPPPGAPVYRLGSRPGGLRLVEAAEGTRIIFLFDLRPVPLFRREGLRLPRPNENSATPPRDNLITQAVLQDSSR